MNRKIVAVTLIVLMSFAAAFTPLEIVFGQNQNFGVNIYSVFPESLTGPVGLSVNVQGTIYTSNGSYQIVFGESIVASRNAEGYYVNVNFTVPEVPSGTYALILRDVNINVDSTQQFTVATAYSVKAVPSSLQEGNSVVLNVAVTGGQSTTSYNANIAVVLPSPLGTKYSKTVLLGASNQKGTASAQ